MSKHFRGTIMSVEQVTFILAAWYFVCFFGFTFTNDFAFRYQRMRRRVAVLAEVWEHVRQLRVLVSRGPCTSGRPLDVCPAFGRQGRLSRHRPGRCQSVAAAEGSQEESSSCTPATHPAPKAAAKARHVNSVRQGECSQSSSSPGGADRRWVKTTLVAHCLCTNASRVNIR